MGDHARREMIVRTTQVDRQNPAYRPIAINLTASDDVSSEVVCFHQQLVDRTNVDILRGRTGWSLFVICLMIGCTSTRLSPPASTLPPPPIPVVIAPSASSWSFNYASGPMRYRISRSAAIESQSDSGSRREVSTNTTNELITLASPVDSGVSFIAVIDTFSTTTQGLIGPVQPTLLPVHVTGVFTGDSLTINSDSSTDNKCNPVRSALMSDLHNLLTRFPAQFSQRLVWQDSVITTGCQAAIATTSRTVRSYVVSGEALYEGRTVLLVQRADTIQAHGEGAQQQHPLKLDASGTGNAVYYLDVKEGRLVRLTAGQELNLTITTSSKTHQFRQSSRQDFRLVP